MEKPEVLYHGSTRLIEGALQPVLVPSTSADHVHTKSAVFATEQAAIACLFMLPDDALFSIGHEQEIAYACIWGTPEEFASKDRGGYLYILPSVSFQKVGKEYEWQSYESVQPIEIRHFASVLEAFKEMDVRVYFIQDDALFDRIQADKRHRLEILKDVKPWSQA